MNTQDQFVEAAFKMKDENKTLKQENQKLREALQNLLTAPAQVLSASAVEKGFAALGEPRVLGFETLTAAQHNAFPKGRW